MKTISLLLLMLLGFVFAPVNSMAQTRNYKHITQNGEIKDEKGFTIGTVSKDQIIKDSKGQKLAFVDNQGNMVDAKTNKKLGHMGKDRKTYFNSEGELIFNLKEAGSTCDILDAKGKKIGNVHSSMKGSACALACFQKKHQKHS